MLKLFQTHKKVVKIKYVKKDDFKLRIDMRN